MNKTTPEVIELFYIGEDFYSKSGTTMSSIYHAESFMRSDWGKVNCFLRAGQKVNIRPATDSEMLWAYRNLAEIQKRQEEFNKR